MSEHPKPVEIEAYVPSPLEDVYADPQFQQEYRAAMGLVECPSCGDLNERDLFTCAACHADMQSAKEGQP